LCLAGHRPSCDRGVCILGHPQRHGMPTYAAGVWFPDGKLA